MLKTKLSTTITLESTNNKDSTARIAIAMITMVTLVLATSVYAFVPAQAQLPDLDRITIPDPDEEEPGDLAATVNSCVRMFLPPRAGTSDSFDFIDCMIKALSQDD